MTHRHPGPAAPVLLRLLILLGGCAGPVEPEDGVAAPLLITDVGYGDTVVVDGMSRPAPQHIEITNVGGRALDLGDCYLSDGGQWTEDGLARLPPGATLAPGASIVIASYAPADGTGRAAPVDFARVHGFSPDYEIGGTDPAVPDAASVRGHIRLHHGACDTDASCRAAFEEVLLIDGAELTDADVIYLLERNGLAEEVLARFPWVD